MSSRLSLVLALVFSTGVALGYFLAKDSPLAEQHVQTTEVLTLAGKFVTSSPATSSPAVRTASATEASDFASGTGDPASELLSALQEPDYYQRRNVLFQVASRLDAEEVANAMKLAESFSAMDRDWAQPTLLAHWLKLDAETASQWVRGLPDGEHRAELLKETFISLGAREPATALRFLEELRGSSQGRFNSCRHELFRAWAQRDPQAAIQQALAMNTKLDRSSALYACMSTWAKKEPRVALAAAKQMPEGESRQSAYESVLREWAQQDPVSAANEVLTLPSGKERDEALSAVINGASKQNPALTRELLAKLPAGSVRSSAISSVISNTAYQDPKTASEYLELLPLNRQLQSGFSIATYYAQQDIAGALEWASQLGSAELRKRMTSVVLQRWAEEAPAAAVEYVTQKEAEDPDLLLNALRSLAEADPQEAITRARALTDPKARDNAVLLCLGVLARANPQQAIREAEALSGTERNSALLSVMVNWGQKEPETAAKWLFESKDPNISDALTHVMANWARETPLQAGEWLQQLPAGPKRDQAVSSFVMAAADFDPEGAAAWAITLQNEQQRENAIRNVASEWLRQDKKAAAQWIRQAPGIPEQTRQNLLQQSGLQ